MNYENRKRNLTLVITGGLLRYSLIATVTLVLVTACSLGGLVKVDAPEEGRAIDREVLHSYTGAINVYHAAISSLTTAMSRISRDVGLFTDELLSGSGLDELDLDARTPSMGSDGHRRLVGRSYVNLQNSRVLASQAKRLLQLYGRQSSVPLISHAFAIEGFSILLLAELYCSGIPLTEVPVEGDVLYDSSRSTRDLLLTAIAKFDSAMQLVHDSLPIITLARVGKGRALLNLGELTAAAEAVESVSISDKYIVEYLSSSVNGWQFWTGNLTQGFKPEILNREGGVGMVWFADRADDQDVRLPISTLTSNGITSYTIPAYQTKYEGGTLNFTIADGVWARLIEAEAQLSNGNNNSLEWLETINTLRNTVGLPDTTDPGNDIGRVNLLFRERAFWLYLTGTRLGDMRRLIKQYKRNTSQVYPSGVYPKNVYSNPFYGEAYVFSPPDSERERNSLYNGCINRNP